MTDMLSDTQAEAHATRMAAREAPARLAWAAALVTPFDALLFVLLIASLAWVPALFGSDRPQAWGINAIIFPVLLATRQVAVIAGLVPGVRVTGVLRVAILAFALVAGWILLQSVATVPDRWAHPIWGMASEILARPIDGRVSVAPDATFGALVRLLTWGSVFWLALAFSRDEARSRVLMNSIAMIGLAYSLLGLLTRSSGYVLWVESPNPDSVTSTFVNRNSFATFAGIALVAGLAMVVREVRKIGAAVEIRQQRPMIVDRAPVVILAVIGCVVNAAALMLTNSRGGVVAATVGVAVLTSLSLRAGRKGVILSLLAVGLVVLAASGVADVVAERFSGAGLTDASRAAVRGATEIGILASPLYGFGYDTFSAVFPMFRDDTVGIWGVWEKAHNTYLDTLLGLGLIGGSLLIAAAGLVTAQCAAGALTRKRNASVPAGAVAITALVAIHAMVDFSLDLQAVSFAWAVALGAGAAQSMSQRGT